MMSKFAILLSIITIHLHERKVNAAFFVAPFSLNIGNRLPNIILQKSHPSLEMKRSKREDERIENEDKNKFFFGDEVQENTNSTATIVGGGVTAAVASRVASTAATSGAAVAAAGTSTTSTSAGMSAGSVVASRVASTAATSGAAVAATGTTANTGAIAASRIAVAATTGAAIEATEGTASLGLASTTSSLVADSAITTSIGETISVPAALDSVATETIVGSISSDLSVVGTGEALLDSIASEGVLAEGLTSSSTELASEVVSESVLISEPIVGSITSDLSGSGAGEALLDTIASEGVLAEGLTSSNTELASTLTSAAIETTAESASLGITGLGTEIVADGAIADTVVSSSVSEAITGSVGGTGEALLDTIVSDGVLTEGFTSSSAEVVSVTTDVVSSIEGDALIGDTLVGLSDAVAGAGDTMLAMAGEAGLGVLSFLPSWFLSGGTHVCC